MPENKINAAKFLEAMEKDTFFRVSTELSNVKDQPRALILTTNGFLEMMVGTLANHFLKCKKIIIDNPAIYTYAIRLVLLYEKDILTEEQYGSMDLLRKERNRAAHEPIYEMNDDRLSAIQRCAKLPGDTPYELFTAILSSLWNDYDKIFDKVYLKRSVEMFKMLGVPGSQLTDVAFKPKKD